MDTIMTLREAPTQEPDVITTNAKLAASKRSLDGRDYLVAPVVMLVEGIHNGSKGPLYYSTDEMEKTLKLGWDKKPIVLNHPVDEDGQAISASTERAIKEYQVGFLLNTILKGKELRSEAWLDSSRLKELCPETHSAITKGKMVEVSTGIFAEHVNEDGVWNGEDYSTAAVNIQPDHLAILPNAKGACSISKGCGLLRNADGLKELQAQMEACKDKKSPKYMKLAEQYAEMKKATNNEESEVELDEDETTRIQSIFQLVSNEQSYLDLWGQLDIAIKEAYGTGSWLVDIFDTFCVFCTGYNPSYVGSYSPGGSTSQPNYKAVDYETDKNDVVTLSGTPQEVTRATKYRATDGTVLNQEKTMPAACECKEEKKGKKGITKPITNQDPGDEDDGDENEETVVEDKTMNNTVNTATKPLTLNEYIDQAPPELRGVLRMGLASHERDKTAFIKTITANKANKFTEDQLKAKDLSELQNIAALANNGQDRKPVYDGMGDGSEPITNEEEPLVAPTMNFDAKKE